ncbi:MAG: hypothetical protein M3422_24970 [Actinomycetota bacterium]|nr:hypothetical protein [Actinomycetota bacterium]
MTEFTPLLIQSTATELIAPAETNPGRTTFRATTTAEGSGWVGLARLAPGASWEEFRGHLRDMVSDDQERIVKGTAGLDAIATLRGGAVIHPDLPAEYTVDLAEGRYVFFEYPDAVSAERPRHRFLAVRGPRRDMPEREPAGTVRAVRADDGAPRFEITGTPTSGRPLEFVNAMSRPQCVEAVLFPLPEGTGEDELAAYFARFVDGSPEWPDNPPFDLSRGRGCLPLSSGQQAVMDLPGEPGRYVVANWLKDAADGVRLVKRGQYRIVELA